MSNEQPVALDYERQTSNQRDYSMLPVLLLAVPNALALFIYFVVYQSVHLHHVLILLFWPCWIVGIPTGLLSIKWYRRSRNRARPWFVQLNLVVNFIALLLDVLAALLIAAAMALH